MMQKFKKTHTILNFPYIFHISIKNNVHPINFSKPQLENSIKDPILTLITKNYKYPFSYFGKIPTIGGAGILWARVSRTDFGYYSTCLDCQNPKWFSTNNEKRSDFDDDGDVCFSEEEVEKEGKQMGVENEKVGFESGVVLDILKGVQNDKVMSGVVVTKKLDECGVSVSSELVVDVLSKIRSDWQMAFAFFLWASKQQGYAHSIREYHLMMSILSKRRKFDTCWTLVDEMRRGGILKPNTLWIMIRRYSAAHDVAGALNAFHGFKRFGFSLGMNEFHKLLCALARYKNVEDAEHLLFSNRNTFPFNTKSFNIILNGWCNIVGSPREANRFWRLILDHGVKLDVFSFSIMISCYAKLNRLKEVLRYFELMKNMGIDPDRKVYSSVIHAYGNVGLVKEAMDLLKTMEDKGISPDTSTYNSLIKPLCEARKRDEAEKMLDKMLSSGLRPTVRSFHAFLHIQRTPEEVFVLLDKMKSSYCPPNKDTYVLLIRKFCRWRELDHVYKFWDHMIENGWNDEESSYVTLIHGLFLNGKVEEAYKLYLEMKEKDFVPDEKTDELMGTWLSNKHMEKS